MGIHLRPGHYVEAGEKGWKEKSYEDFLTDIVIGPITLGYWGKEIEKNKNAADAHSPIYSIPNPWAAAYLFNYVMGDNTHPLSKNLVVEILNIISDYALFGNLELFKLSKPEPGSPFNKIWNMAPGFLKYNDNLMFFKDVTTKEIVGGISKSSLVWTSQKYIAKRKYEELQNDTNLIYYLKTIQSSNNPEVNYNAFWQHNSLQSIVNDPRGTDRLEIQAGKDSLVGWLGKATPKLLNSVFVDESSNCMVFSNELLKDNIQIFNDYINPAGFIEKLRTQKGGKELPMNMGASKWVVIDSLLEPCYIINDQVECSDANLVHGLQGGILYPVNPKYLSDYQLKLNDLKVKGGLLKGAANINGEMCWKEKLNMEKTARYITDKRSISIWPPFKSDYFPNYVIEYCTKNISSLQKLEFYDEKGEQINIASLREHEGKDFRTYKLEENKFPKYIRIKTQLDGNTVGGFIEVTERSKNPAEGKIIIGIDFGTSHTSVFYSKHEESYKMLFENSTQIMISDAGIRPNIHYNFIPERLSSEKPSNEKEYNLKNPWQPFLTRWMNFTKKVGLEADFIEDGIIPFTHFADDRAENPLFSDLKWGAPQNIARYRGLFLKQLITMAVVEAEAVGFKELEIKWSYPKAFSTDQMTNINHAWNEVKKYLKISNNGEGKNNGD